MTQTAVSAQEYWIQSYSRLQALWMHREGLPHVVLRSGQHSAGFFNSRPVINDQSIMVQAAHGLVLRLTDAGFALDGVDCVVGPQTGATELAKRLASEITQRRGYLCRWASPAKVKGAPEPLMAFDDVENIVHDGDRVLLCEDVVTTGGSAVLAEKASVRLGGRPLGWLLALVNRSGLKQVGSKTPIALIDRHLPSWNVPAGEACPLCAAGSRAIENPKDHWSELETAAA